MKEFTTKEFNDLQRKQFVKINFDLIKQRTKELHKLSNEFLMYNWMVSNIAREKWDDSAGYPLKSEFYEKGYLVCTFSIRKLTDTFGSSKSSIKRYIKNMEELRWLDIAKVQGVNKYNEQNVYILGNWCLVSVEGKKEYLEELYINNRWENYNE